MRLAILLCLLGVLAGCSYGPGPVLTTREITAGTLITAELPELPAPGYEYSRASLEVGASPLGKVSSVRGGVELIQRGTPAEDYVAFQRRVDTSSYAAIEAAFGERTPQRVASLIGGLELVTYGESLPAAGSLLIRHRVDGQSSYQVLILTFR